MTFSLGSINFNNGVADSFGNKWWASIDGWDTLSQRTDDVAYVSRHGNRVVANLYEARQMTISGTAECPDAASYWEALYTINAVSSKLTAFLDTPLVLTITEDIDKQMEVLRTGFHATCIEDTILQFDLDLRADDPFKYSTVTKTVATSGTATNAGNARSFIKFTSSSTDIISLWLDGIGTGTWWTTLAAAPSGTVVDMKKMTVLNGVTSHFGLVDLASTWLSIPAGNTPVAASGATGTWSWKDAWL